MAPSILDELFGPRSGAGQRAPMSSVDRAWLRMDDPTNLMVVNAVLWLAEPLPRAALEPVLALRLAWLRRMREHPEHSALWTHWAAGSFALAGHVHEHELDGAEGSEVEDFISGLVSEPLDPCRPLWALHLIHRPGQGTVVLTRVHHSVGDGIAQLLLLLALTDEAPPAANASPGDHPLRPLFEGGDLDGPRRFIRALMPTGMKLLLHADHLALDASERDPDPRTWARSLPERSYRLARRGARFGLAVGRDLASLLLRRPDSPTPFRGQLGVAKRVAWSPPLTLAAIKRAAHRRDSTVNDYLVAAMTGALRRYIVARGRSPEGLEIRAAVPINLRGLAGLRDLGNRFGLVFLTLPVGLPDARARLAEVHRRMDALKHSVEPAVTWAILELMGATPSVVEGLILDYFAKRVSFVMTNMPGPERRVYLAGREIEGLMFWVPQSGRVGLGLSICSYAGELRVGVAADARLVPDPRRLVDAFTAELDALAREP